MSEPIRVLAEGTIRYYGSRDGSPYVAMMTARVFVVDWSPGNGVTVPYATVVAREPLYLPNCPAPSPAGSLHHLPAHDEDEGDLLTVDTTTLVGAYA